MDIETETKKRRPTNNSVLESLRYVQFSIHPNGSAHSQLEANSASSHPEVFYRNAAAALSDFGTLKVQASR